MAGRGRLWETVVSAAVEIAQSVISRGRVDFGLYRARVVELRQRPLRCYRCLARGHVSASCPSPTSRASLGYQCGQPGQNAKNCKNRVECPLCRDAGHRNKNHHAGTWKCLVFSPRKTNSETFATASASEARVPGVSVGGLKRGEDMEIDVDPSTPKKIVNRTTAQDKDCDRNRFAGPVEVVGAPLRGLDSEGRGEPSVHWKAPSEPSRTRGEDKTPLWQRDLIGAHLWGTGVVARCCGGLACQAGHSIVSEEGGDQAVLGGGSTGHLPSSAYNCHESGVGDPALTLDNTSGSSLLVGNLPRGSTDTTGSRGRSVEEGRKCTVRSIEDLETDTILVRTHKRARPILYTSSSEDEVIDLTNIDEVVPEGPSVSNMETGRLIEMIIDNIAEAEERRKTCGNIKGEISGKMKSCHLEIMGVARKLQARNRANCGPNIHESLEQLRAEAKATNNWLKQVEEECTRLRRKLRRKNALLEKVSRGEASNTTRAATAAASQARSLAEKRLIEARKDDDPEGRTIGRVLTELTKSILRIQVELKEEKMGQGSYAKVAARPRVATPQPTSTPLTTVPDEDGFVEERRKNKTAVPAGGPLPTRDVGKVRGKDANIKADRLAQAMKGALPEAKIARP
ncbi:hypothetical protein M0804_015514 [Polistes exclamans]|nr:hypothetical protein M0804_015514 [Polistes exclamans]